MRLDGKTVCRCTWVVLLAHCRFLPADEFAAKVRPLISKYCIGCHDSESNTADVALDHAAAFEDVMKSRKVWEKVVKQMASRAMPPADSEAPTPTEYQTMIAVLRAGFEKHDAAAPRDPGRVTIRRLNRAEYNNTIRDLFGVELRPADDFPADDLGYGFDNIGDVLSVSPLLMDRYLAAAEMIVDQAIADIRPAGPQQHRIAAAKLKGEGVVARGSRLLATNSTTFATPTFPRDGEYKLRVRAFGDQMGKEPVRMEVRLNDRVIHTQDVPAPPSRPKTFEWKLDVEKGGPSKVSFAFINDDYRPEHPDPRQRDRNLYIQWVELVGPLDARESDLPEPYRRVFVARPGKNLGRRDAARIVMKQFARRAYRRSVEEEEVDRLMRVVDRAFELGADFDAAIRFGLKAALVSPNFLFRAELHSRPMDPTAVEPIGDFDLASRLSYFLWSSMPDDELLDLAEKKQLSQSAVLEQQVRRLLKDPKSKALTENFAGQWLETRKLNAVEPDPKTFPMFDDALRSAMKTETEMFFSHIVAEDRSILEFIDAPYTFVNERLAKLYRLPFKGRGFRKIELSNSNRGGVLTQASFLTITSNPTRTSPVKRGKWVLEQFLNDPPPPPPADAGELEEAKRVENGATLRKLLEQHRRRSDCASCHQRMDPIGFGLENFDGIGAWREKDGGEPVDNSGILTTGESFNGPAELKKVFLARKDQFTRCLAEKMLTYALGRGMESYDKLAVDQIAAKVSAGDYRFSALVLEVVRSDPFLKRRGDGGQQ